MINKVILVGNLGADVEIRYTQDGTPAASFTVATTERWKGKDGQMQEQTEWHRVTAWRRLAEICGEYLAKGSRVYIEGKLQTRSYEKDGQKRYVTEIVAREMKMLSPKPEGAGSSGASGGGYGGGDPFPEPPPMGDDVPF